MGSISVEPTAIPDVKIITTPKFGDTRGFFSEVYNRDAFAAAGIEATFVQDSHSRSAEVGTLRGLHFQSPPFAQDKLVRVIKGRIWDVAVDIRKSSPTYGRWVAEELSASNWRQLLIPVGFLHGFCTLEADVEVIYKVSNVYSAAHDFGVSWNDPDLAISWPDVFKAPILSAKDAAQPRLRDIVSPFA